MTDLLVTYPAGSTTEGSAVAALVRVNGQLLFAVERTPCHPLSPRWPDQPADRCTLAVDGARTPVQCAEGFLLDDRLQLGEPPAEDPAVQAAAIPCVVHIAPADAIAGEQAASGAGGQAGLGVGEPVTLSVDEDWRAVLSLSHSRCHLVSLALNAALKDAWRKEPPVRDSLGHPDFDKLAIASSSIDERGSLDCYRVGKSLRKSGLQADALEDPQALAAAVRGIAQGWLLSNPEVSVKPGSCPLRERREWSCALPAGAARFPCGGTHPSRLHPDPELRVKISWDSAGRRLAMRADGGYFHV